MAGGLLLVVMAGGLLVVHEDAKPLYDGLTSRLGTRSSRSPPAVPCSRRRRCCAAAGSAGTRLTAVGALASLVLAWGMAQRPYALPTTLTVDEAAGDPNTMRWLVIVTIVAVALVGPALALLYRLDLTDRLAADHDEDLIGGDCGSGPLTAAARSSAW